jgi:glycosyltransferase involved in cell wall biosynthesis
MRKFAVSLRDELSKRAELMCTDPRSAMRTGDIIAFKPDIIHYIPGPSPASLFILRRLKKKMPSATTISTITHPYFFFGIPIFWKLIPPDAVLTFSYSWRDYLSKYTKAPLIIPGAVDTGRYKPVTPSEKRSIRKELGLPEDAFIALHVGHMRRGRGLSKMASLVAKGITPVIVVSKSTGSDLRIKEQLIKGKCIVVDTFVQRIESYYQAADCYAFPTQSALRAMDLPLSILEAMACNLPVVSFDFGCISKLYGNIAGMKIVDSDEGFIGGITGMRDSPPVVETRKAVESNDWSNLANVIYSIYDGALK